MISSPLTQKIKYSNVLVYKNKPNSRSNQLYQHWKQSKPPNIREFTFIFVRKRSTMLTATMKTSDDRSYHIFRHRRTLMDLFLLTAVTSSRSCPSFKLSSWGAKVCSISSNFSKSSISDVNASGRSGWLLLLLAGLILTPCASPQDDIPPANAGLAQNLV